MKEFHIQFHITNRCNLRCIHCYQEKFTAQGELTWSNLKYICDSITDTMKRWKCKLTITLTGGEPFLKPELWTLLDYLDNSIYVRFIGIITNGTFVAEYINEFKQYRKFTKFYVSLDGICAKTNDYIRGEGVYKKIMENISLLIEENMPVCIMFTLLNSNYEEAKFLCNFVRQNKINEFIIERFIPLGQSKHLTNEVVSNEKLAQLFRHIATQCSYTYIQKEMAKYRAIKVRYNKQFTSAKLYGAECTVSTAGIALLPDGTVLPCRRFYIPVGNILHKSLHQIWNESNLLLTLRNRTNLEGNCKTCIVTNCIGCRALTYQLTGNYLSSDPHCLLDF